MDSEEKTEAVKKAVIGFLTTLIVAISTRVVTAAIESESFAVALAYVMSNAPFLVTAFLASVSGGYFAQKWTRNC